MTTQHPITATREKLFFTLSSLPTIRTVMLREAGAYDIEFIARVRQAGGGCFVDSMEKQPLICSFQWR